MGPLWHEPFAQALNHDENYACRCANDSGARFKTCVTHLSGTAHR